MAIRGSLGISESTPLKNDDFVTIQNRGNPPDNIPLYKTSL